MRPFLAQAALKLIDAHPAMYELGDRARDRAHLARLISDDFSEAALTHVRAMSANALGYLIAEIPAIGDEDACSSGHATLRLLHEHRDAYTLTSSGRDILVSLAVVGVLAEAVDKVYESSVCERQFARAA